MADPAYRTLRPTLAIADAIAIDDSVGLNPKLVKLAERYQAGQVAIVEGVGLPRSEPLALRVARLLVDGHAGRG